MHPTPPFETFPKKVEQITDILDNAETEVP
jgi:hypothetical protein